MEHETITVLAFQRIDNLFVARSTQGRNYQGLGFTTGEERRTMCTGQNTATNFNRTNGARIATVNAGFTIQNLTADNFAFNLKQNITHRNFINIAIKR